MSQIQSNIRPVIRDLTQNDDGNGNENVAKQ